ncbi:hypothetical protein [Sulfuricystis multivorans]|uniref:hypothetical protein n=1 Tax=Sulfuricystis multivorans TaxID=2211108 RepID=UPI0024DF69EB|nr:hypothetical protein [Sulfuricystis multivorans]
MTAEATEKSALALRRLLVFDPARASEVCAQDFLFDAPGAEAGAAECAGIVVAKDDAARADALLAAGALCVFVGEAALRDSESVRRLAAAYPGRIGIYTPARRMSVSWSFETESNADFKTVAPSLAEPAWEVLTADGSTTGTHAAWWLKAMRELGASQFIVLADVRDDADLNILAGLVEDFGDSLWIAPRDEERLPLADWLTYGQCRQLALVEDDFARRGELLGAFLQPAALESEETVS